MRNSFASTIYYIVRGRIILFSIRMINHTFHNLAAGYASMILQIAFLLYAVFLSISSILLDRAANIPLLVTAGMLFLISIFLESRFPRVRYIQIVLLACFHFTTQLNWTIMMYFLLAGKEAYRRKVLWRSLLIATFFMAVYSSIRLLYNPGNTYTYMTTIYDQLSMLSAITIVYYLVISQSEKRKLRTENEYLSSHDSLTGLLNFHEFHRQLEELIAKQPIGLLLIDCLNFTSANSVQGFEHGDKILKKFADILNSVFADAYIIARYGDNKFAVVLTYAQPEHQLEYINHFMFSEIPKLVGIQVAFGYAGSSVSGTMKDEVVHAAEEQLAEMKRDLWLRREDQMLRAEKLRLIGELAAGLAHEIRNPLTTIKGFLQVSKENEYNIEPYFPLLMEEITRISELTGEFLQFSKPNIGNFRPRLLQECIQRVIQLMESEALLLGHEIRYQAASEPLVILMDRDKIVQLLLNLIKNALEAMKQPGIVTVTLVHDAENGKALLTLADTGPGIPKQHQGEIFNPFFTTKSYGTGLGLSICHKIVQDHDGSITFTSSDEGTCFTLTFPLLNQ